MLLELKKFDKEEFVMNKKILSMILIFTIIVSSLSCLRVNAETISGNYSANDVTKIFIDGKEYAKGATIQLPHSSVFDDKNDKIDINVTSIILNDGTMLSPPYSFVIDYRVLTASRKNGVATSLIEMYVYENNSYVSILNIKTVSYYDENEDKISEQNGNASDLNKELNPYGKLKKNFLDFHLTSDNNSVYCIYGDRSLKYLLKNKSDRKKAKFYSLNKKLFKVKNNKLVINTHKYRVRGTKKKEYCYPMAYKYGMGYLQVKIDGKEIGKVLIVIYPDDDYHEKWYPHITQIKKIDNNKVKIKFFYPKKKYDVTNINDLKICYQLKMNGKTSYAITTKTMILDLKNKKNKIKLNWSTNYKDHVWGYLYSFCATGEGEASFALKKSKVKKMKKNKWYKQKDFKKLGIRFS